jgi:hypothetical protein
MPTKDDDTFEGLPEDGTIDFGFSPEELKSMAEAGLTQGDAVLRQLASGGWTVPLHLTPAETRQLLHDARSDLDAALVKCYSEEDGAVFDRITAELGDSSVMAGWQPLLDQCVAAYRSGSYHITIPSLFAMLEGIVVSAGGQGKVLNACGAWMNAAAKNSWTRVMRRSVHTFLKKAFSGGEDFVGPRPTVINRHWVLHGRDRPAQWRQADALRLFTAVHATAQLTGDL